MRHIIVTAIVALMVACGGSPPSNRTDNLQEIINREFRIPPADIAWQVGGVDTSVLTFTFNQ